MEGCIGGGWDLYIWMRGIKVHSSVGQQDWTKPIRDLGTGAGSNHLLIPLETTCRLREGIGSRSLERLLPGGRKRPSPPTRPDATA